MIGSEIRKQRLIALVDGIGQIVFNYGRPFALNFPGTTVDVVRDWIVPILYFDDIYNLYIRQGVQRVEGIIVNCAVCEAQYQLGYHDGLFMRSLLVPAIGPNGKPWVWTRGHRRGKSGNIRYQHIIACNDCVSMAQQFPIQVGQVGVDWRHFLPQFRNWMLDEDLLEHDEKKSANEVSSAFWNG